jgi:hypothetical protein
VCVAIATAQDLVEGSRQRKQTKIFDPPSEKRSRVEAALMEEAREIEEARQAKANARAVAMAAKVSSLTCINFKYDHYA